MCFCDFRCQGSSHLNFRIIRVCNTDIIFNAIVVKYDSVFKLNVTVNMYIPTFPVATILDSLQAHRSLHGYIHFVHESRETCHEAQTA